MSQRVEQAHRPYILIPMHACYNGNILDIIILVDFKGGDTLWIKFRFNYIIKELAWFLVDTYLFIVTEMSHVNDL
jgi:hypothetical protein